MLCTYFLLFIFPSEPDFIAGWLWRIQQLFQVFKYQGYVFIMSCEFLFHFFQLQQYVFMGKQKFPHFGEHSYYLNVYPYSSFAIEYTGKYSYPLFGKYIW